MNEEDFLIRQAGKERPFTVPENYFSDFAQQMIDNLPQKREHVQKTGRKVTVLRILRPIVAAACICGAVFCAGMFFTDSDASDSQAASNRFQYTAESNMNQMLEYAMLDNEDFYNYVLGD